MSVAALATRARSGQKRRLRRFDFLFPRIDAASQIGHDATGGAVALDAVEIFPFFNLKASQSSSFC
jgi:hypothetical protein